ncbi:MAG: hypothetical protein ACK53T_06615 [Planctomycetota bacterium]
MRPAWNGSPAPQRAARGTASAHRIDDPGPAASSRSPAGANPRFGNPVSARDVYRLCERLPQHAGTLARRLLWSGRRRTVDTYSRPAKDDQWWSIPAVLRRWNRIVTGDEQLDHHRWIADRQLPRGELPSDFAVGIWRRPD